MIRKDDLRGTFPNWGKGQSADKTISETERDLECAVSQYISNLQVLFIDIADKATKNSARSKIERLSIALFTEGLVPVESPSAKWLGLFSAHDVIAQTGLWNIRDVGGKADLSIVRLIDDRITTQTQLHHQFRRQEIVRRQGRDICRDRKIRALDQGR